MANKLSVLIDEVLRHIPDAKTGLPQEVFYFVSQLTPMVNVDLLIKNKKGQTLLTWRQDQFYGPAWHIPGGIIRFKEKIEDRIAKVAETELGCQVSFLPEALHFRQIICERNIRGHFISLLYLCELASEPEPSRQCHSQSPAHGEWAWHDKAPDNLLVAHEPYRLFIDETPPL